MKSKSCCPLTPPTAQLLDAIEKLEAYVSRDENMSARARFSETFFKLRSLFSSNEMNVSKAAGLKYRLPSKQEMNMAVEIVNRSRLLIEKLCVGTEEEKELAESLTHKIAKYNSGCDLRIKNLLNKQSFLQKLRPGGKETPPKVALMPKVSFSRHYPGEKRKLAEINPETARAASAASILIPKQSAELFHMKVLALLERYGIASNHEARVIIKNSPIHIEQANDPSTCTLVQTLTLFPGQTVIVKGTSSLDPITSTIQKLFPETFSLTLESTQTGFPDPSQRCGWTLPGQIIPYSPQRIDLLSQTAPLFHKKLSAINGLQPQGDLLKRAKSLIAARRQTFNKHSETLLPLLRTLFESIVENGYPIDKQSDAKGCIGRFFDTLEKHPKPFDILSEVSRAINEVYVVEPRKKLIDRIIKGKETSLGSDDAKERYSAVNKLFDEFLTGCGSTLGDGHARVLDVSQETDAVIACIGKIIGSAAKEIILQYFSEDLVYAPPTLTYFQSTLQTLAYHHLASFQNELFEKDPLEVTEPAETLLKKMMNELNEDIAILKGRTENGVAKELADYFDMRHASLT